LLKAITQMLGVGSGMSNISFYKQSMACGKLLRRHWSVLRQRRLMPASTKQQQRLPSGRRPPSCNVSGRQGV